MQLIYLINIFKNYTININNKNNKNMYKFIRNLHDVQFPQCNVDLTNQNWR